jgi:uncharacterized protein (DUF2147 family)
MIRKILLVSAVALWAGSAIAAEPIEGNWKTEAGDTARIAPCPEGFCITLVNGKYANKQIGNMKGNGGLYNGKITDPKDDKTYEGSAAVSGSQLKLQGCVLKVFCKSQVWTRL